MTKLSVVRDGDEAKEHLCEPMDAGVICPCCQTELPVVEVGHAWCWRCRARYWVEANEEELHIHGVEAWDVGGLEMTGNGVRAACEPGQMVDDIPCDEIDPDGGIHGFCPLCGEWLIVWISGRCRCEACGSGLVVGHRRGRVRYDWLAEATGFESVGGWVRTAWRDDLTAL